MYNPYNQYSINNPYMQNNQMYNNVYSQQLQQLQSQGNNVLPPQQVPQANGKASIDTLQMSPNSSILIMDTSAPIVWLCVSDGLGKVTATPYDITVHQDTPPIDIGGVEQRLTAVEEAIAKITEVLSNGNESNATKSKSKQTGTKPDAN